MANETLSVKQAGKIIDEANQIMALCVKQMEQKSNEFVKKVSTVWEDKNAVEYMKDHKKNFDELVKQLGGNNRIFASRVKDIAEAYIRAGGMAVSVAANPISLVGNFIIDAVKEVFDDSDGDRFGFKDSNPAVADQVMAAFNELKTALTKIASDTINKIKSINAFGNINVGLNLAQSAGAIVGILNDHIADAEKILKSLVEQTARTYANTGSSAETAAKISSN